MYEFIKTNQMKIRSKRVISELDTWIYKGTAARIDHQDGAHDDTLTCLAMGIFVINFSEIIRIKFNFIYKKCFSF